MQLAKHLTSLSRGMIDRTYLSDIKQQAGLIKCCIVRLRHSNSLFHHRDIWSLELAIMNTRSNCLFCNYKCMEGWGQVVRSPYDAITNISLLCGSALGCSFALGLPGKRRVVGGNWHSKQRARKVPSQETGKDFPSKETQISPIVLTRTERIIRKNLRELGNINSARKKVTLAQITLS